MSGGRWSSASKPPTRSSTATSPLFSRGHQPAFAGINTFMKAPYCEDIRKIGDFEAAFVGAPFDSATTYRPGDTLRSPSGAAYFRAL